MELQQLDHRVVEVAANVAAQVAVMQILLAPKNADEALAGLPRRHRRRGGRRGVAAEQKEIDEL